MSDLPGLLWSILCDPADDAVRLVYADALEEAGQTEQAEFVRVQARLAATGHAAGTCQDAGCPCMTLACHERALLDAHREAWFPPWHALWAELESRWLGLSAPAEFHRGFVRTVNCPLAWWMANGPAVCGEHPVEAVTVVDREPFVAHICSSTPYCWATWALPDRGDHSELPVCLAALMDPREYIATEKIAFFPTETEANAALSRAAVQWARQEASLPLLP